MFKEEIINRAFGALQRNVKLVYTDQERNQISFGFSDDSFFGFIRGSRNFKIILSKDKEDWRDYLLVTIILLNDNTSVQMRYHTSFILPKLKLNKHFQMTSLYTRGVLGNNEDYIYESTN